METNKLDTAFGPVGRASGTLLLAAGIVFTFFSASGLILMLMGGFIGFTYTRVSIDFDSRKVKFSNMIFGILPVGKWLVIQDDMMLKIKKSNKSWSSYSRSNRELEIPVSDYRLVLCNSKGLEIMYLKKFETLDDAKNQCAEYSRKLAIPIVI